MEYSEIIEANKMIAEFMGFKKTEKETGEPTYTHSSMEKGTVIWAGQFSYHNNWNTLMDVIAKIEAMDYGVYISTNAAYLSDKKGEVIVHCNNFENKLQTVYEAVVSFVNYHNSLLVKAATISYLLPDNVHPDNTGHAEIAAYLK